MRLTSRLTFLSTSRSIICKSTHAATKQIGLFRCSVLNHKSLHPYCTAKEDILESDIEQKVIYNTFFQRLGFVEKKRLEKAQKKIRHANVFAKVTPVSLKYLRDNEHLTEKTIEHNVEDNSSHFVHLPFATNISNENIHNLEDEFHPDENISESEKIEIGEHISDIPAYTVGKWMNDYEKFSDEQETDSDIDVWRSNYGTSDPKVPVSQVPCGGCGALLHCQDHSIPGYLPSEIFKNCSTIDLREIICQRCHFLKNYNTALSVKVDPDVYPKLISKIKCEKALVILIADMADLPCSLWPGILDIIGYKRPLFLIGNKVDLLWGDRKGWLEHALSCLKSYFPASANVKYASLISAKTGFGVEELITKLHNVWQYKGDVYLVGCANVGKSSLFNALLQSDYCKVKAVDLIQRATIAPWPGTTINLLKFPILRPEGWRLYLRTMRLKEEQKKRAAETKLRKQQRNVQKISNSPQLLGYIGRTFFSKDQKQKEVEETADNFTMGTKVTRLGLDVKDPDFAASKWVYDTPGVLHQEQILEFLTTEEVSLTMPKEVIEPRTFSLKEGWTLFIAGLARIDYLTGDRNIKLTVFSSNSLPITITELGDADEIYTKLIGTEYMCVPHGPQKRLEIWPGLQTALEASFVGIDHEESCADVTLSSAGWISVTPEKDKIVKLRFWTPNRRGVHIRTPSLLPKAVALRGKKISKSPAYQKSRTYNY